jgi:hypothetical protein
MKFGSIVAAMVALILPFALSSSASAQESDKIAWSITPYMWASDTSLDLTVEDAEINAGVEIPFSDLLDILDTAFQIHVEGGKGKWSSFADFTLLETSDTIERPLLTIGTSSKQIFLDAAVAYWPQGFGSQLNFYGGVRYTGTDNRYEFSLGVDPLVERRSDTEYFDALVGVRYRFDFSERWGLLTRADLSFGDSDGTALVQGLFAYTVGKRQQNRILFGYQYKQAEFKDTGLDQAFEYSGPMAGFNFRF